MEDGDAKYYSYCPHIGLGGANLFVDDTECSINNSVVDSSSTTDYQSMISITSIPKAEPLSPTHIPLSLLPMTKIENGPCIPPRADVNEPESVGENLSTKTHWMESGDNELVDVRAEIQLCEVNVLVSTDIGGGEKPEDVCPIHLFTEKDSAVVTPLNVTSKSKRGMGPMKTKRRALCITCSECSAKSNLWRCLGVDCGSIYCGANGNNHAQTHFQDNPDHMIQQNVSSRRIWCNLCEHEVYKDFRNRRTVPAIWFPEENIDEFPPRGLYNIGNTCYMNAAIQNIAAVSPLTSYFMGDTFYDDETRSRRISSAYRKILDEMFGDMTSSYTSAIMPSRLLYAVRQVHPIFRGYHQHDSQEFLRLFMDSLASETKVPHFTFEESPSTSEKGNQDSNNESDTESYETADSGNGSEETLSTNGANSQKPEHGSSEGTIETSSDSSVSFPTVKVTMRSIVDDVFNGKIESSVECLSCHETSCRLEEFQDLSLPIPTRDELTTLHERVDSYEEEDEDEPVGWFTWIMDWFKEIIWGPSPTIYECLGAFFSSDELKGKNMYSCENCKELRNGLKRCTLFHLPEVLCVHLKRFRMLDATASGVPMKINQSVTFPLNDLNVQPFLHPDCPDQVSSYRLIGVICHHGSAGLGHYISYIRKGNFWFMTDDCRVTEISALDVKSCEAYVLFYQKWDTYSKEDEVKNEVWRTWRECDRNADSVTKFHLISRKWLTQYSWGEESIPLDNTDVVCPHGRLVPVDNLEMSATWVPDLVWNAIVKRYGGGPDLKSHEFCQICAVAWKKHQKTNVQQRTMSCNSRTLSFSTMFGEGTQIRSNRRVSGSNDSLSSNGALQE